jgi:glutamine synthetase
MKVCVEYVWIGGGSVGDYEPNLRSKSRTLVCDAPPREPTQVPHWNFDGSSTNQADTKQSEVVLVPAAVCADPFRGQPHLIALCETYTGGAPHPSNKRHGAKSVFTPDAVARDEPWFGLEQEYVIAHFTGPGGRETPLLWNFMYPARGNHHYCGVGFRNAWGREIAEEHYQKCLQAGLTIAGINAEVMQAQWEFQVGPLVGIEAADQLWLARYILLRVAEKYQVTISFLPKRVPGFSGSGCHANVSTKQTRENARNAEPWIAALEQDHARLMLTDAYGKGNELRLTGDFETAPSSTFSAGIGDRAASVRIPTEWNGYFEDRRPAANADPYCVTGYLYGRFLENKFSSEV